MNAPSAFMPPALMPEPVSQPADLPYFAKEMNDKAAQRWKEREAGALIVHEAQGHEDLWTHLFVALAWIATFAICLAAWVITARGVAS